MLGLRCVPCLAWCVLKLLWCVPCLLSPAVCAPSPVSCGVCPAWHGACSSSFTPACWTCVVRALRRRARQQRPPQPRHHQHVPAPAGQRDGRNSRWGGAVRPHGDVRQRAHAGRGHGGHWLAPWPHPHWGDRSGSSRCAIQRGAGRRQRWWRQRPLWPCRPLPPGSQGGGAGGHVSPGCACALCTQHHDAGGVCSRLGPGGGARGRSCRDRWSGRGQRDRAGGQGHQLHVVPPVQEHAAALEPAR